MAVMLCALPALGQDSVTDATDVAKLQAAAQGGDPDAQYNLGTLYQQGDVVPQNDVKAVYWFRKSADQGDPDGEYALGFAYRGGFGVPMDRELSYMWFDIAARAGNEDAANMRSAVAELMTYAQINEARGLAKSWKPGTNDALLRTSDEAQ
jgi:TPR repeat protein